MQELATIDLNINSARDTSHPDTSLEIVFQYMDGSSLVFVVNRLTVESDIIDAQYYDDFTKYRSIVQLPTDEIRNMILSLEHPIKNGRIVVSEDDRFGSDIDSNDLHIADPEFCNRSNAIENIDPGILLKEDFIDPLIDHIKDYTFYRRELLRYVVASPNATDDDQLETQIIIERDDGDIVMVSIDDIIYEKYGPTPSGELQDETYKRRMEILFSRHNSGLSCDIEFSEFEDPVKTSAQVKEIDYDEIGDYIHHFQELIDKLQQRYSGAHEVPLAPYQFDYLDQS